MHHCTCKRPRKFRPTSNVRQRNKARSHRSADVRTLLVYLLKELESFNKRIQQIQKSLNPNPESGIQKSKQNKQHSSPAITNTALPSSSTPLATMATTIADVVLLLCSSAVNSTPATNLQAPCFYWMSRAGFGRVTPKAFYPTSGEAVKSLIACAALPPNA